MSTFGPPPPGGDDEPYTDDDRAFDRLVENLSQAGGPLADLDNDARRAIASAVYKDWNQRPRLTPKERRDHHIKIANKLAELRELFLDTEMDPHLRADLGWRPDAALPLKSRDYLAADKLLAEAEARMRNAAKNAPVHKGRPEGRTISLTLVRDLAAIYTDATGKKAVMAGDLTYGKGGPFFDFVSAVLAAASYEAAPETIKSAIKEALKDRSRARPSSP